MTSAGTRAAFGWYGSKARLAPKIAAMAAAIPHRVYVEPYAGSAAVLFRKPRCPVEIINDIDGDVVNFFRVLRDQPARLARAGLRALAVEDPSVLPALGRLGISPGQAEQPGS